MMVLTNSTYADLMLVFAEISTVSIYISAVQMYRIPSKSTVVVKLSESFN